GHTTYVIELLQSREEWRAYRRSGWQPNETRPTPHHPNSRHIRPSSLAPAQLHNLSPACDDPLQPISPQLKSFTLLLLISVMDVDAEGHACLGRGTMVGDVA